MHGVIAQDIGSRAPQDVGPRLAGHAPGAHGRGHADDGHAALRRIEVFRLRGLGQIAADTGVQAVVLIEVAHRREYAAEVPVDDVVVGPGEHVEPQIEQVLEHLRPGSRPGAAADRSRVDLEIMQQYLEIREAHIESGQIVPQCFAALVVRQVLGDE